LNETERNYEIHDKEILAVIKGLENWRHLLEDTKFKFEVWTYHKNLEYFMNLKASLLDFISIEVQFHFKTCTKHKNGKSR